MDQRSHRLSAAQVDGPGEPSARAVPASARRVRRPPRKPTLGEAVMGCMTGCAPEPRHRPRECSDLRCWPGGAPQTRERRPESKEERDRQWELLLEPRVEEHDELL